MIRKVAFGVLMVVVTATLATAGDTVSFMSAATLTGEETVKLTGKLTRPTGDGPFPAVVLLHGCEGIAKREDVWAEKISSWGYVTLQVDSFGPRGESETCIDIERIPRLLRLRDAFAAKLYLSGLPFVDGGRIAVMGWAHVGGTTAISAVNRTEKPEPEDKPFRAAVALYPWCLKMLVDLDAPLLIIGAGLDERCSPESCKIMREIWSTRKSAYEFILKIYPGVHHGFDWEGVENVPLPNRLVKREYDSEAASDAIVQVKNFLARHLK